MQTPTDHWTCSNRYLWVPCVNVKYIFVGVLFFRMEGDANQGLGGKHWKLWNRPWLLRMNSGHLLLCLLLCIIKRNFMASCGCHSDLWFSVSLCLRHSLVLSLPGTSMGLAVMTPTFWFLLLSFDALVRLGQCNGSSLLQRSGDLGTAAMVHAQTGILQSSHLAEIHPLLVLHADSG